MAKKSYAVIGLGQFGSAIVEQLVSNGADVIAIDKNEEVVKKMATLLPTVFIADCTNEKALEELGVNDVDAAIVAFGDNKEASVLTTVILKEFGIDQIIVRVDDEYYASIIKKLGATEVITPQQQAGAALANRLDSTDYKDFYKLNDKYSVVSIKINPSFIPMTLAEMNPKIEFGINIVLISRRNKSIVPGGNDSILPDDNVFVVGSNKDIRLFREYVNGKHR